MWASPLETRRLLLRSCRAPVEPKTVLVCCTCLSVRLLNLKTATAGNTARVLRRKKTFCRRGFCLVLGVERKTVGDWNINFQKATTSDIHKQAYWAYLSFHLVVYPTKMINQVLLLSNNIGVIWIEVLVSSIEIDLYLLCHLHIYAGVYIYICICIWYTWQMHYYTKKLDSASRMFYSSPSSPKFNLPGTQYF